MHPNLLEVAGDTPDSIEDRAAQRHYLQYRTGFLRQKAHGYASQEVGEREQREIDGILSIALEQGICWEHVALC